jgi:RimJ/RimL family protein N-acetyltransferase/nitroimidazol reductase NimA-like FMN-containing flavoprotein (pyridoxamine 5'-phosphate oxidase superfamily)
MHYDREAAHAILDEAYDCSVAFVVDGEPRVLPTLHARVDDTLYLHGSSGGRLGLMVGRGEVPVCVSVTLLDGIVYARSHVHHSANYRSVVVHGRVRLVTDQVEKRLAMNALVDKVGRGRAADSRPPTRKELAETGVLALPLAEVSVRARTGGVVEDDEDLTLDHWAGVLPLRRIAGPPEPAEGVGVAPPGYLAARWSPWRNVGPPGWAERSGSGAPRRTAMSVEPIAGQSAWHTAVPLRGRHVMLEQLAPSHVDGLFAALADDDVWRYLSHPRPVTRDDMAVHVTSALRAQWHGERVPWVQRDPHSGAVIGVTMYHDVDESSRSLAIGHTMLGKPWWRSGVNSESKLLLLEWAFEVLGAERVFWYTDIRNERSQRAIARLGASRDGVIRRHRKRPDGSWRDSVMYAMTADEWPAAAARLRARLAAEG